MYPLKPIEIMIAAAWDGVKVETWHLLRPVRNSDQLEYEREIEQALVLAHDDEAGRDAPTQLAARFRSAGMIIEAKCRLYDKLIISVRGYNTGDGSLRVAAPEEGREWVELIPPNHKARAIDELAQKKMPPPPPPAPPSAMSTNTGGGTNAAPDAESVP